MNAIDNIMQLADAYHFDSLGQAFDFTTESSISIVGDLQYDGRQLRIKTNCANEIIYISTRVIHEMANFQANAG